MAEPVYTFSVELETGSFTDLTTRVERGSWGQAIVDIFHAPVVGNAMFELSNDAGDLGTRVNSSFQPGRAMQLTTVCSGVTYALFYGKITNITARSQLGARTTIVEAVDDWDRLQEVKFTTRLFSGTAVQSLWTELMSASSVRSFQVDTNIADACGYAWYHDHAAPAALHEIAMAGNYQVLVDGNGTYQLRGRNWSLFDAASTANFITASWALDFRSGMARETIFNRVRVLGEQRVLTTDLCTVAYLPPETPISIPASTAYGFWFDYYDPAMLSGNDTPCGSLVSPVASGDWYTAANSDGSGTDMTSGFTLTTSLFAASAVATFTNNTASGAYLTRAQLRGYPLRLASNIVRQVDITSSQTRFGLRALTIQNRLLQWNDYIGSLATHVASDRKDGMHEAQATLVNRFPVQYENSGLGKVVGVEDYFSGQPTTWRVRAMDHTLEFTDGLKHTTSYQLDSPQGAWGWGKPDDYITYEYTFSYIPYSLLNMELSDLIAAMLVIYSEGGAGQQWCGTHYGTPSSVSFDYDTYVWVMHMDCLPDGGSADSNFNFTLGNHK